MLYVVQDGQGSVFTSQGYRVGSAPYAISVHATCAPYSVRTNAPRHFSRCEGEVSRSLRVIRVVAARPVLNSSCMLAARPELVPLACQDSSLNICSFLSPL